MTSPPYTPTQVPLSPVEPTGSVPPQEFQIVSGDKITDDQLVTCAELFSKHYGVWGPDAPKPLKPGARVKMQPKKLLAECLGDPAKSVVHMMYNDGRLIGQAFATKWSSGTETVGWITQLVVDANERRKRIATNLLRGLAASPWFTGVTMMGIASTHPAAYQDIGSINMSYIQENAPKALRSSTVKYVRQAQLHGRLFEDVDDGAISLADTAFYVDHGEPEEILSSYVADNKWCLGALRPGHEYLLILPVYLSRI